MSEQARDCSWRTRIGRRLAANLAALLATLPAPLLAAEIFSSFAPGNGFDETTYTPVNFYTQPEVIGTNLAFAFSVPVGPAHTLQAIEVAASWDGTKKNALFSVYADAGGVPQTAPVLILADNPAALEHITPSVVHLSAPAPLVLEAGAVYWFSVSPSSLDASVPADDFVLLWLNPELTVTQTSRNSFDSGPWEPWFTPAIEVEAIAFRVLAQPVPLPPAVVLLPGSLLVLWRRCKRRATQTG